MSILDKFSKTPSTFSKITSVDFFKNKFATGFTKNMISSQQTDTPSKFSVTKKIFKYKP